MENPLIKHMLCRECKKVYSFNIMYRFIVGIGLICLGVFVMSIPRSLISSNEIYQLIPLVIGTIFFGVGIMTLFNTQNKARKCHDCQSDKPMIAVDTYDAVEFIKSNNLSLPKPKEVEKKASWQA